MDCDLFHARTVFGPEYIFSLSQQITFHLVVSAIALTCAIFEAVTLLGVSGLRNLWQRPDPIADIANRSNTYKAALDRDLIEVRKLAKKRYGYAFAIKELRRWHDLNPHCLYLMFSDAVLVGYVDAFPISAADYDRLLAEEPEELITPLRDKQVDPTCSFYIASVVVEEEWGAVLPTLLRKAVTFYSESYTTKCWGRVCAIGYSPQGRTLLQRRGAQRVHGEKVQMFMVDRSMLPNLSPANRALWSRLLPPVPVAPMQS
jgi:hypothetical protein